jgi:hypothetical protein
MSLNDKIHNSTIMKFSFDDDEFYMMVIMTFLPFVTFGVVSLIRHSVGSENVVFEGIVSKSFHHYNTIGYLFGVELSTTSYVFPNILNESPSEIIFPRSCKSARHM